MRDFFMSVIGVWMKSKHLVALTMHSHWIYWKTSTSILQLCGANRTESFHTRDIAVFTFISIRSNRLTHYFVVCLVQASHKRRYVCSTNRWQNIQTTEADIINRMVSKLRIICILYEMMLSYIARCSFNSIFMDRHRLHSRTMHIITRRWPISPISLLIGCKLYYNYLLGVN